MRRPCKRKHRQESEMNSSRLPPAFCAGKNREKEKINVGPSWMIFSRFFLGKTYNRGSWLREFFNLVHLFLGPATGHFLRCDNQEAEYEECPQTTRHSLRIPLRGPASGEPYNWFRKLNNNLKCIPVSCLIRGQTQVKNPQFPLSSASYWS